MHINPGPVNDGRVETIRSIALRCPVLRERCRSGTEYRADDAAPFAV